MNILPGFEAHLGILPKVQPDGSAVQHSSKINRPGRPDPNPTLPRRGFQPDAAPLPRGRTGRAAGAQPWTPPARPRHSPPARPQGAAESGATWRAPWPRPAEAAAPRRAAGGTAQRRAGGRTTAGPGPRRAAGQDVAVGAAAEPAEAGGEAHHPERPGRRHAHPALQHQEGAGAPEGRRGGRNRPGAIAALPPHRAPAGPALRLTACGSAGRAAA